MNRLWKSVQLPYLLSQTQSTSPRPHSVPSLEYRIIPLTISYNSLALAIGSPGGLLPAGRGHRLVGELLPVEQADLHPDGPAERVELQVLVEQPLEFVVRLPLHLLAP